ncbi:DNA adenine methylase [Thioflexithrix psekupsensis]|uniref:site-specific DNA-methyltransferase (adenine-specific) n=1 Tax=Thioflexithrix psekupsensis TaxID=1570016 RepID=A0A251X637_9GAMM|nr:DNA adenine methylase [Thioflexithrix psekupsensis]OUD13098.1 modification methylase [Thioflexithrix psekupsensis]
MIKSPLRYPGGKSKALTQILPLIPDFEMFREPFVGGGSVFLALKQRYPNKNYWINDLYFELYKFWEYAQKDLSGVIRQVKIWKEEFENGKALHRFLGENMNHFDDVQRASAFFVFNRITFSGTTEAGGFSQQAFQKRFTESSIHRLGLLENVLKETKITHLDYAEVVNADGEKVFIFLDPPYFSATQSALYGKNGKLHKKFDHERFAEVMKNCQHQWLITYDNCDYIKDLFSFAHIVEWNLMYGMRNQTENSDQLGKEIFIANFELDKKHNC